MKKKVYWVPGDIICKFLYVNLTSDASQIVLHTPVSALKGWQTHIQNKAISLWIDIRRIKKVSGACVSVCKFAWSVCLLGSANETLYEHSDQCTLWLEQSSSMNINFAFIASCPPRWLTWHRNESAFCLCQRLPSRAVWLKGGRLLYPASLPQGHGLGVLWFSEKWI